MGEKSARPGRSGSGMIMGDPVIFQVNASDAGSGVDRVWMVMAGPQPQEIDFMKDTVIPMEDIVIQNTELLL